MKYPPFSWVISVMAIAVGVMPLEPMTPDQYLKLGDIAPALHAEALSLDGLGRVRTITPVPVPQPPEGSGRASDAPRSCGGTSLSGGSEGTWILLEQRPLLAQWG